MLLLYLIRRTGYENVSNVLNIFNKLLQIYMRVRYLVTQGTYNYGILTFPCTNSLSTFRIASLMIFVTEKKSQSSPASTITFKQARECVKRRATQKESFLSLLVRLKTFPCLKRSMFFLLGTDRLNIFATGNIRMIRNEKNRLFIIIIVC